MVLERNFSEYTLAQQYQILESESFQVSSGYISRNNQKLVAGTDAFRRSLRDPW